MNVGVFLELKDHHVKKAAQGPMTVAAGFAGERMAVLFAENSDQALAELAPFAFHKVLQVWGENVRTFQPDIYATILTEIIRNYHLTNFMGLASLTGKDLLPRVAAKLDASIVSDCIDVDLEKSIAVKPLFAGKVISELVLTRETKIYGLRPNVIPVTPSTEVRTPEVIKIDAQECSIRARIKDIIKGTAEKIDLAEAEIIISGGRGMKNRENFSLLFDAAKTIGAAVGASRAAVDAGYADQDMQVGQTGKVVNPVLYIACGISGAIQHQAGMKTSKVIVAINTDPEAPIFKIADYGIVGDLFQVVPILKEELAKVLTS
jgi:electron transfer flavoprotein alpha subunit